MSDVPLLEVNDLAVEFATYGGSVKASNARELMAVANVNGALVGRASLTILTVVTELGRAAEAAHGGQVIHALQSPPDMLGVPQSPNELSHSNPGLS